MIDSIADMLIRIKNSQAVGHKTVKIPFSKIKLKLAQILEKEGFVGKTESKSKEVHKYIKVNLKYNGNQPVIKGARKISKVGQRIYVKKDKIYPVKQGYGISIISTSKGLMTDRDAKNNKVGGEVICEIW